MSKKLPAYYLCLEACLNASKLEFGLRMEGNA